MDRLKNLFIALEFPKEMGLFPEEGRFRNLNTKLVSFHGLYGELVQARTFLLGVRA